MSAQKTGYIFRYIKKKRIFTSQYTKTAFFKF